MSGTQVKSDSSGTGEIPDKNYYKIGEVAVITGLEPYVLRYWETEFKEIKPVRARSKQRLYRRQDLDVILKIKRLLYEEKFTIAGAKRRLIQRDDEPFPGDEAPPAPELPDEGEAPPAAVAGPPMSLQTLLQEIKRDLLAVRAMLKSADR